jgi:hypothetical protein
MEAGERAPTIGSADRQSLATYGDSGTVLARRVFAFLHTLRKPRENALLA